MNVKLLLAGVAAVALQAPLLAQETAPPPPSDAAGQGGDAPPAQNAQTAPADDELMDEEGEEIVVTGTRERGAVLGDIEPEVQLNRRDIRTFGAGSLSELLDALAPQTRSARGRGGGGPVVLLNGRRISGFSEIRDIPPEAIERVDILPEEVALKYGYRADQRVVNFVLRRRFRAFTGELEGGFATEGGRGSYEGDVSMLRINQAGRVNLSARYAHSDPLFESERDIIQANPDPNFDAGDFRTLLGETDQLSLNGTLNRIIFKDVSATANARFDANSSRSFLGRRLIGDEPLIRETDSLGGHLGLAFSGDIQPWRWSTTANLDRTASDTATDTNNPRSDTAHTVTDSATAQLVASGPLFALPAGNVSSTVRAGFDALGLESETVRAGLIVNRDLSRERESLQANLDVPIASRRREVLGAIGDLSVNFNAEVENFSDFGTLRTLGAGLNWSPIPQLDVIASVTDEDGAPSMQQLGDPLLVTPNVQVFDYVRGETAVIDRIDGGNPNLLGDNRRVFKLGFTLNPIKDKNLSLTGNYTSSRILDPIASFPTATAEIEAAFPDRFVRDAGGRLIRIDNRPVNFARSDSDEIRWGINFSKPIGRQPQPGAFGRGGGGGQGRPGGSGGGQGAGTPGGAAQGGQGPRGPGGGGGGRGGGRGGFGGFGGGRGGGLQFAIYHNWHLTDTILIRPGVPELDLLNGSAVGSRGGQPRHEIEVQAGIFKNGLGARLSGNWQSGTTVRGTPTGLGGTSSDLFFSDFATLNLRLFADLGAQRDLVRDHPWLRGVRVSLAVDNLFGSRLEVRDAAGITPLSFQPGFVDPLGRSVRISIRKLFLPRFRTRARAQD